MQVVKKEYGSYDPQTQNGTQNTKGASWEERLQQGYEDRFDRPDGWEDQTTASASDPLSDYFAARDEYLKGLEGNVQSAYDSVQKHYQNAPSAYTPSAWQDKADAAMEQYLNRGAFRYNVNEDALYQQYKDQYIQQGRLAMMDTMGQAAAMTGGYGNSYAQNVGQQAYHQYLQGLNNVVPELYGMAQDRYDQEGEDILNRYSLYTDREAQEQEKYQQALSQWQSGGQALQDAYTAAQNQYVQATTFKEADAEMEQRIENAFAKAEDADAVWDVLNKYQAMGYDPTWLYVLASQRDMDL